MPTIFKTAGVYRITNIVNGKFYIGSSIDIANRWKGHKQSAKRQSRFTIHAAMRKYGLENFRFEVVEECEPIKEILIEREQHYLDTLRPPYNILPKAYSNVGYKHTVETRAKISENYSKERKERMSIWSKEYMNRPEIREKFSVLRRGKTIEEMLGTERANECRQKASQALRGHTAWNKGIPWSDEVKQRLSEAHMGQPGWNKGLRMPEEQRQRMSEFKKETFDPEHQRRMTEAARLVNLGTPRSEETRKKIGDAHRGIPSEMRGIPRTEETKQKVSEGIRSSEKFQESVKSRVGKKMKNNTSGHYGIIWDKSRNQWQVRVNKKMYGRFATLDDAIVRRDQVMAELAIDFPSPTSV